MLPILIWILVRRSMQKKKTSLDDAGTNYMATITRIGRIVLISLACIIIFSQTLRSQDQELRYKIIRNDKQIGWLKVNQVNKGNQRETLAESEIHFKFIFSFDAYSNEKCMYENGILQHSSIYRKVNGKDKSNKQTNLEGNVYYISSKNKKSNLNLFPIRNSIICLFHNEPQSTAPVYSENLEQFLDIKKTTEHQYQITLPNGDSNLYTYEKGICTKVEMHYSLFTVQFVLNGERSDFAQNTAVAN